jgi:hypothetical protein
MVPVEVARGLAQPKKKRTFTTKWIMSLRSPTDNENGGFFLGTLFFARLVIPAHAGIQVCLRLN